MSDRSRKVAWTLGKGVIIALILVLFGWLLSQKLKGLTFAQLQTALASFPAWRIALALALTALNYVILAGYDYLALRYLRHSVRPSQLWFGTIVGYAMSFNFGWIIGGSTVRYRLYSSWGFTNMEIAKLIGTLTVTFWVGVFAVAGLAFVISPLELPQEFLGEGVMRYLPFTTTLPLGIASLVFVAGYLTLCAAWHKPLRWGTHEFTPPSLPFSLCQIFVASLDQFIAAAVFYVLLPDQIRGEMNYLQTVNIYLLFTAISALLHIPGGMVVLEKVVLDFIGSEDPAEQAQLAATLIVYRVVYYFIPLAVGGVMMLIHEWGHTAKQAETKHAD